MFAPAFAPLINPEAVANSKLALAFCDAGWEMDIISRSLGDELLSYNYGSSWDEPWSVLRDRTHSIVAGTKVVCSSDVILSSKRSKTGLPVRGLEWAVKAFMYGHSLHKRKRYDFVLSRSLPDSAHVPALFFSRKTGVPWIANWNDPSGKKMPEPYGRGPGTRMGVLDDWIIRKTARYASIVTFPCSRLGRYISSYLPSDISAKSCTVPHVLLPDHPMPAKERQPIFTVCYAGTLYGPRKPETFFRALSRFLSGRGDVFCLKVEFIGLENIEIGQMIRDYGLGRTVSFQRAVGYEEMLVSLARADALLVIEADLSEGIFFPSKFVDYVQTGRPILAIGPKTGTLHDILSDHGGGIHADVDDVDDILRAINTLYRAWVDGTLDGRFGSVQLKTLFSSDTVLDQYRKIFDRLSPLASRIYAKTRRHNRRQK